MTQRITEQVHGAAAGLDALPPRDIARRLHRGQVEALQAVEPAMDAIVDAAALAAGTIRTGGRLIYCGAGSSGLMAAADAMELGGTFGIPGDRVAILMAGGLPQDANMPGATEDDATEAERAAAAITAADCVIAVTASGSTPYPLTVARIARDKGARTVCIANNAGAAIFAHADVAVCLPTPPELIAGSTRMGAGTAQKVALNMISTLMGISLGHVHDGMMVNLHADNAKLRARSVAMVGQIAGVAEARAAECLDRAGGAVKRAVLLAAGATSPDHADALLSAQAGHLRAALEEIGERQ